MYDSVGRHIRQETMEDCKSYIEYRREGRHRKTLVRQVSKYNRLCHRNRGGRSNIWHGNHHENCHLSTNTCTNTTCNAVNITDTTDQGNDNSLSNAINTSDTSNISNNTSNNNINNNNNRVRNFSKTPLTEAQQRLLSHGPNFVITPREPPTL